MKVDEGVFNVIQKVMDITNTDYEITWTDAENIQGHIDDWGIVCMLEDLLMEIEVLNEKYKDLEEDVKNNYELKLFDPWEEYGISPNDFH